MTIKLLLINLKMQEAELKETPEFDVMRLAPAALSADPDDMLLDCSNSMRMTVHWKVFELYQPLDT